MSTELTLPGTIPGLLRRCSPVRWRDESTPYVVLWCGPWPGSDSVDEGCIALAYPVAGPIRLGVEDTGSNFALDLTDATGRAHAAMWLDAQPHQYGTSWGGLVEDYRKPPSGYARAPIPTVVRHVVAPARLFADLDPDDPRTLPDGSKLVDAEALRRVVLHVAGVK